MTYLATMFSVHGNIPGVILQLCLVQIQGFKQDVPDAFAESRNSTAGAIMA